MNYIQATSFLEGLTDYEKSPAVLYNAENFDLQRVSSLLGLLGNPHLGMRTIHITGTKGKGSTAAMIANVLRRAGYRVGLFTSPHLVSWQERIAVNGRPITKADFARLTASIQPIVMQTNSRRAAGKVTTFEAVTALAFCHFRERGVDFQVLETGLGGRLDSTNVVQDPDICIIASISLDHTQVLGDTLGKIASEKAGIIKPGCTVVCAPQPPEALKVITERCKDVGVPLVLAGRDLTWRNISCNLRGQRFIVRSTESEYELRLPLLGDFQMENAALVVGALEALRRKGVAVSDENIVEGLRSVKWPARMQILGLTPALIVDGAHNPYSFEKMIQAVRKTFRYGRAIVIFGSSRDKDIEGMANELQGFASRVILTSSAHQRAADADRLVAAFTAAGVSFGVAGGVGEALGMALSEAGKNDLVLAAGSLFLAADVCREFAVLRSQCAKKPRAG